MEVEDDGGNSWTPNEPLHDEANITDKKRQRLSGAARKRLKKLITSVGVDFEEAVDLCRKPWRDIPADKQRPEKPLKRTISEEKTVEQPVNETPNLIPESTSNQTPRTFKRIREATRVGIRNTQPMSEEQMSLVHRHLILSIAKMDTVGDGPEFLGFSQKSGWILVTCVNQRSHDWLVEEISKMKPWPRAQLTAVREHELPRSTTVVTLIPKSEASSIAEAKTLLKVQNTGLKPGLWRVLNEKEDETGKVVTFAIDEDSLEALRRRDYVAILGFRRIFFKIRKEKQTCSDTSEPTPSSSGTQRIPEGTQIQRLRSRIFPSGSARDIISTRTMSPQNLDPNERVQCSPQPRVQYAPQPREQYAPQPREKYAPQPREQYAPQPREQYAPQPREQYAPKPREQYAPKPREQYAPQPREEYAPQPREEYAPQPRVQYALQPREEYASQTREEYAPQPREQYVPQPREEYAPQPREEYAPQPREQYAPKPREQYAPQPREQYAPQPREEYSPKPREQYAPQPREEYAPQSREQYAPKPREQYAPKPREQYAPQPREEYAPQPREEYAPQPRVQYALQPREQYAPQPREEYAPQPREKYAPQPREQYAPQPREEYAPLPREQYAPKPREQYAPQPREQYAPQPREEYAPQPREEYAPQPRVQCALQPRVAKEGPGSSHW